VLFFLGLEMNKVEKVVKHFGTQVILAQRVGVSQTAVSHWVVQGYVPAGSAVKIERLTRGKFKAVNLVE